ncbi:lysozyme-like domain-containing protein, partial [Coemansia spiralis]
SGCPKSLALQLTNVFQYGQIQFNYSNCGKDDSGNGYAAGIVNFCTGTSDAWEVIKAYHSLTGGNDEFTQYDSMLKKYASTNDGSTKGLDGFCNAWKKAATNQKFWSAQGTVFDKLYFAPSQAFANKLGLQLSVSQGQMYDAAISHG